MASAVVTELLTLTEMVKNQNDDVRIASKIVKSFVFELGSELSEEGLFGDGRSFEGLISS